MTETIDNRSNYDAWLEEIRKFKTSYVKVGVTEGAKAHSPKYEGQPAASMAMVAFVHEMGAHIKVTGKMRAFLHWIGIHLKKNTTEVVIPERSFIRSWVHEQTAGIQNKIISLFDDVNSRKMNCKQALDELGRFGQSGIKNKFMSNNWPPLKFRSGQPLMDTKQLYDSIDFETVMK